MKSMLILFITIMLALHVQAQLNGTRWKTTLQLDQPMNVVFNFHNDTLSVVSADGDMNLETSKFSTQDTVLTLQKLFGKTECDTSVKGTYSFKINNNQLSIVLIADNCFSRSDAIKDIKLEKVE